MALLYSHLTSSGSLRVALSRCHAQKAVHMGLPIRNSGFCSAMSLLAASRRSGKSKSHGTPSSSLVVRSSASPGTMPYPGIRFAHSVTLGGLYTSVTACVACCCCRLYLALLPPSCSTS